MHEAQTVVWTLPKRYRNAKGGRVKALVRQLAERERGKLREVQIEDAIGSRVWVPADSIAAPPGVN